MKMRKKASSISPSERLTTFSAAPSISMSEEQNQSTSEERITSGISFDIVDFPMDMGMTSAVHPTIIRMLNMLEPTTFPIAISELPLTADMTLMTSSGAEVPKATIVRPITRSEIRKRLATAAAPSVR